MNAEFLFQSSQPVPKDSTAVAHIPGGELIGPQGCLFPQLLMALTLLSWMVLEQSPPWRLPFGLPPSATSSEGPYIHCLRANASLAGTTTLRTQEVHMVNGEQGRRGILQLLRDGSSMLVVA